jgi:hypothetical protein
MKKRFSLFIANYLSSEIAVAVFGDPSLLTMVYQKANCIQNLDFPPHIASLCLLILYRKEERNSLTV